MTIQKHGIWSLFMALALIGVACSNDEEQSRSAADKIDQYTGIDTTKPLISDAEMQAMNDIELVPYTDGTLWGFADKKGKVVIEPQFQKVQPFSENTSVVMKDSLYGVIDKRGRVLVEPKFPLITTSACGVFAIKSPAGYVLMNRKGKRVLKGFQEGAFRFTCSENRVPVKEKSKVAFYDSDGKRITDARFDKFFRFRGGHAPVAVETEKGLQWGVIDSTGRQTVPFEYHSIYPFERGLAVVSKLVEGWNEPVWGVIDPQGNAVVPIEFGRISGTFEGDYVVCQKYDPFYRQPGDTEANTWHIYDRKGNKTGESDLELWDNFQEGLIVVEKDGQFGFADETGSIVIAPLFDWACGFSEGMAWVKKSDRYGFIDKKGKPVIALKYGSVADYVFMETEGVKVRDPETGEVFYIDKTGKEYRNRP